MLDIIRENIKRTGWHATAVGHDPQSKSPSFIYTAGFQVSLSTPDIIMVGFDPNMCHQILSGLFQRLKAREISLPEGRGKLDGVLEGYPVLFIPVCDEVIEQTARATTAINGDEATVLYQMQLPDVKGRFPGDPDCDPAFALGQDIMSIVRSGAKDSAPTLN